jgi:hypothetical protein
MLAAAMLRLKFRLTRKPPDCPQNHTTLIGIRAARLPVFSAIQPAFEVPGRVSAAANTRKQASNISDVICRKKAVWLLNWGATLLIDGTRVPHIPPENTN